MLNNIILGNSTEKDNCINVCKAKENREVRISSDCRKQKGREEH